MTVSNHPDAPRASAVAASALRLNQRLRLAAAFCLVALILLCVAWEAFVAPLRPGGSWMILKAVPLLLPLKGVLRGSLYTFQWAAMLSLLYVGEGAVRLMSDPSAASIAMAWLELALAGAFFVCAIAYVRPAKQAAKRVRRN